MQPVAPHPLRLLAAWPESSVRQLKRAFAELVGTRRMSLSTVPISELSEHLHFPGSYHILVIPVGDFERLDPAARQRYGKRVNLFIPMPGGLETSMAEAWLPLAPAGIAFPVDPGTAGAVDFLVGLCAALVKGEELHQAVTASWQVALPGHAAPFLYLSSPDGSVWPVAQQTDLAPAHAAEPAPVALPRPKTQSPAVYIAQAFLGPTSLGDQVNLIRTNQEPVGATYSSGGDQVNIVNSHPALHSQPSPRGAVFDPPAAPTSNGEICPHCQRPLQAPYHYCTNCGAQIAHSDP